MQKYEPSYEPVFDTLKRLMSHGLPETEAKLDICLALRDRKKKIELQISRTLVDSTGRTIAVSAAGKPIIDPQLARSVRFVGPIDVQIVVPRDLTPDDLDWENSRPLKPWPCEPRRFGLFAIITRLELATKDVKWVWRLTMPAAQESTPPAPATNDVVTRVTRWLIEKLKDDPDLRPVDLKPLLLKEGFVLRPKQFSRAWKTAREVRNLGRTKAGARRKSSQR
jgi:hypothetical protein